MEASLEAEWVEDLRRTLKSDASVPVGLASARNDVRCIELVAKGIRRACLLTICTAWNGQVVASLAGYLKRRGVMATSFLLIHSASEQIFVVHRELALNSIEQVYCPISHDSGGDRCSLLAPPFYLKTMIDGVTDALRGGSSGREVLVVDCPSNGATTGIALAGWLLEYLLVYYDPQHLGIPISVAWREEETGVESTLKGDIDSFVSGGNVLSNRSLCIFTAGIRWSGASERQDELMQFTVPSDLLDEVVGSLHLSGRYAEAIVNSIRNSFNLRLEASQLSQSDAYIHVQYEQRTMGHVTM